MVDDMPSGLVSGGADITDPFFSSYEELWCGATHVLYRARRYGRWYVLKGLREELRDDPFYSEWLYKEYSIGVSLDHPNIVRVESLEDDAVVGRCIVMEWFEGDRLDRCRFSRALRKRLIGQLLDAVGYCHGHGVYHHDIKPSNIIVAPDGRLKLIDFGLSDGPQYASFKQSAGSPGFAAPEQVAGAKVDHRADIYALGCVVRMLFPHRYRRAVRKATSHDPDRRPSSIDGFRRLMRPRLYLWLLAVLGFALVVWALKPSDRRFSTVLESGQTVYYRVLQNFPSREVALTCPSDENPPWPDDMPKLQGDMVVPATLRHRGFLYHIAEIDNHAFRDQYCLTSLQLPEGLRRIGIDAFLACSGLSDTLVIPTTLRSIGSCAFDDCFSISHVVWQADSCEFELRETNSYVFCRDYKLEHVYVTSNVRYIPNYIFQRAGNLKTVVFEDGLKVIAQNAFPDNSNLDSIVLPATLSKLGHAAFYGSNVSRIVLPDSVYLVGAYSFAYDRGLRSLSMGSQVKFVGNYAFTECCNLETITIRTLNPPEILETSFNGVPLDAVLRVPKEAVESYRSHPIWGRFVNIEAIR